MKVYHDFVILNEDMPMPEKPSILKLKDLERPSMTSTETYEWLKKQGLNFNVKWDPTNPQPVLMITTEKFREQVVKNAPNLLTASFVIVKSPTNAFLESYSAGPNLYTLWISKDVKGREYDVYSVDPTNNEVLPVLSKYKDPKRADGFQTELPYLVIDENNKELLRNLGCKFDW